MSCFVCIEFITEDWVTKYINNTTKLKCKVFTKLIKNQGRGAWVWIDRESKLKLKRKCFNWERVEDVC
jgi:hypothetical protein